MRRVSVIGSSGSGKTTVARALATKLGVPFVELDELHWRHAGWKTPPLEEFRTLVDDATRGDRWVVDGSYGKARDICWSRADTVVWLDLPFWPMFWRILRRTVGRMRTRDPLWGVQYESFRAGLFSRDSLLLYMVRTHRRRARVYREWLRRPEYAHLSLVHLRTQRAIDAWLSRI